MPRYFFDVHTTERLVVDEIGEELDCPDTALQVAIALLQCTDLGDGGTTLDATVRDQAGQALLMATLDIRVQRLGADGVAPARSPPSTPALVERSRALLANSRRAATELDQAVTRSSQLLEDLKRRLVEPRRLPRATRPKTQ